MHIATRTVAVLAATVALTAAALPATHADEPAVTVRDRLGQIAQVDEAVPISKSPTSAVKAGRVTLGASGSTAIAVDLPVTRTKAKKSDGRYVLPGRGDATVAVAPTTTGTQILVGLDSAEAPTSYRFGLGSTPGVRPELTPDGGVDLVAGDGTLAAQVEAPWAVDAEGRRVPTRYEVREGAITQIVDHRAGEFAYPIVADPKLKFCDFKTAVCVKFSKKETKKIHNAMFVSVGAGISTLCGQIPAKNPAGIAVRAVCAAAVAAYFYKLRGVFKKAKKQGKCVELKFRIVAVAIVGGKVVKC
ncbi:hypothetical protein H9L21_12475 [Aeromicrobium senzhongii]|uniref:Uncharacterized protein n=1 Tax=Aeromicrobium senzhongii TaxID=2663859 RepID=A0ABX6SS82_9ACTN|nr:hypothetical protein [Aeromicrobium senzhongii]MTB88806.1 hypothetical protein [Aeromicrobium senzhongii]QNL93906.1 hypothetical protein H9L21_12475 [Aeromicrobium senzhongii]